MKLKIRDFVLCAIVLIALILLIPSFRALTKPAAYYVDPQYMSLLGGTISVLSSKASTTYGELIKKIGVIQVIQMVVSASIPVLTFFLSHKQKKTGFLTVITVILSICALDWIWLDGHGFSFYALLGILFFIASIVSPIVGKIDKAKK